MKRTLTLSALAVTGLMALTPAAFAADEYNTSSGLTAAGAPLGLHGVDPVAFVDLGNRIDGTAKHTATHDGVAYYFASEDTKKAFEANPAAYLPENGGFCTYGVSVGKKFDGDPQFAAVVDDKLYLFLNEEIFRAFQQDVDGTIKKAADNWKKIRSTAASEL
ncbi:YHS domain-containing (seleno)protein [Kiloniella sp. b19]|uniref:YHS domain-containing (seleno)protein n=1 Tax=Kiloniella sp. GXU_MW_B19 TaxID=3141326 RepID=UPI0031E36CB5